MNRIISRCFDVIPANIIIFSIFSSIAVFFIITGNGPIHDAMQWQCISHYFYTSVEKGILPFWNPYSQTGSPFFPYYQAFSLLEPFNFVFILIQKLTRCSTWVTYILHHLFQYFLFISGAYNMLRIITKNNKISFFFSIVLLFVTFEAAMRTGFLAYYMYFPFITYFILKFIEENVFRKKGLYLFVAVYLIGISFNFYIPSALLFYLLLFILFLLLLRITKISNQFMFLSSKEGIFWVVVSIIVFILSIFPLIATYLDVHELFPSFRIFQKNGNYMAKLFASDLHLNFLSENFSKLDKVSITLGNLYGLLLEPLRFKLPYLYSEVSLYLGILPLVFILFAILKMRNKYVYLFFIIAILSLFVMTGFNDHIVSKVSLNQRIMSTLFFFIKPLDVYQSFGMLFLFCFVVVSAMGFKEYQGSLQENMLYFALGVMAFKYSVFILLSKGLPAIVSEKILQEILIIIVIWLAALLLIINKSNSNSNRFKNFLITILLLDLLLWNIINYNIYDAFIDRHYSVILKNENIFDSRLEKKEFERFRRSTSFDQDRPLNSFYGNEIYKTTKVAFPVILARILVPYRLPRWDSFFMTIYYYDYLANINIRQQPVTSNISTPILNFFPLNNVIFLKDKYDVAEQINKSNSMILKKTIFIEKDTNAHRKVLEINDFFNDRNYLLFSKNEVENFITDSSVMPSGYQTGINVKTFNINMLLLEFNAPEDGYLYFGDGYSKHWNAYVDSQKVKIEKTNLNFKSIYVSKGFHAIKFVYDPELFRFALYMYFLSALIFVFIILYYFILYTLRYVT